MFFNYKYFIPVGKSTISELLSIIVLGGKKSHGVIISNKLMLLIIECKVEKNYIFSIEAKSENRHLTMKNL